MQLLTQVPFGLIEIEGLMFDDGSFGIAVPQIAMMFPYFKTDKNNASILLKRLMGKGFKTDKFKTEFNRNTTSAVNLKDFVEVIKALAYKNDTVAAKLRDSLIGLSLTQLFSDAFGIKFEQDERQNWLKNRQAGIVSRKSLTSIIKTWYENNPGATSRPIHNMYSETTNRIYQVLWNLDAKGLEALLDCGRHESRNHMDTVSLKLLDRAEANVFDFIELDNIKPVDAVELANIRTAKNLPIKGVTNHG
jgi:hypothetical protein